VARKAHGEKEAEEIACAGLSEEGLAEADRARMRGNDVRKARIAQKIAEQTTVSMKWIAQRLRMRSAGNVSQILHRLRAAAGVQLRERRSP